MTETIVALRGKILSLVDGPIHGTDLATLLAQLVAPEQVLALEDPRLWPRHERPPVAVFFTLPGVRGQRLVRDLRRRFPASHLVAVLPSVNVEILGVLLRAGCDDYVIAAPEAQFVEALGVVLGRAATAPVADASGHSATGRDFRELGIIGRSRALGRVISLIRRAADSNVTVLITGESGTGKELVARAVHQLSARRERAFVPVNCGAIPKPLVESELFGHTRGAFSGAIGDKLGLILEAEGGTLFLDEICDLPLEMQVKMNRVLQEREVRRLGDNVEVKVDVRFVAASNKDFAEEIRAGRFREDLFFRLNVLRIHLPPLRERQRDIIHLAEHFARRFAERESKVIEGLNAEAIKLLVSYPWPGNVRELENTIERAVLMASGVVLTPDDLPPEIPKLPTRRGALIPNLALPYRQAMRQLYQQASQAYVEELLSRFGGNVSQAARHAGLPRESLHRILRSHGIQAAELRQRPRPPEDPD